MLLFGLCAGFEPEISNGEVQVDVLSEFCLGANINAVS